jgi:hypothetical protein
MPVPSGTFKIIDLSKEHDKPLKTHETKKSLYLGESTVVKQVLHDKQIHVGHFSLARPLVFDLLEGQLVTAEDFSQQRWALIIRLNNPFPANR